MPTKIHNFMGIFLLLCSACTQIPPTTISPLATDVSQKPSVASTSTQPPELNQWKTFEDNRLGYSIQYSPEWYAYAFEAPGNEIQQSVLFSNAPDNKSFQTRTENETARLWIAAYSRKGKNLSDWVLNRWDWINGKIIKTRVKDRPALQVQFSFPDHTNETYLMLWIENGDQTLFCSGQFRSTEPQLQETLARMLANINFLR